jgi:hypothetical protein
MDLSHAQLTEIASILGPDWSAGRHHNWPIIKHRIEGYFYFRLQAPHTHWHVGCEVAREGSSIIRNIYKDGKEIMLPSSINISVKKAPALIAKDIARRLLQDYEVYLDAAEDRKLAEAQSEHEVSTFLNELSAILHKAPLRNQAKEPGCHHLAHSREITFGEITSRGKGYGRIEVSTGNSCTITINSLSRPVALKLAKFLTTELSDSE